MSQRYIKMFWLKKVYTTRTLNNSTGLYYTNTHGHEFKALQAL